MDDQLNTAMELASLGVVTLHQREYRTAATFFADSLTLARKINNGQIIAIDLTGTATVASAWDEPARAAHLLGAADALSAAIGAPLPAREQALFQSVAANVRAQLGEAGFLAAWREGRAMTLEQAIEYALTPPDSQIN
jgi:hypothetical protein